MELTIKLDDHQVQFLLDGFARELDRRFRGHLKRHHKVKLKKLKGG